MSLARAAGVLLGLAIAVSFDASAREAGLPSIQAFTPAQYGGGGQNWAVLQDARGVMYFGNSEDGVLEFDGVRWRSIPIANRTAVRSLALGPDGRIYVGAQGDFGRLEADAVGKLKYRSLVNRLPPDDRRFADVWSIFAIGDAVYFFTPDRLFRLRKGTFRVWRFDAPAHLAFSVGDRLFLRQNGTGLLELVEESLRPVPGGSRFADDRIYAMLSWPSTDGNAILIGSRNAGWTLFDGRDSYRPWHNDGSTSATDDMLYAAMSAHPDALVFGTLQGGARLLNRAGRQQWHLGHAEGLPDDTVFALGQDREWGIWIGHDAGLSRVSTASPISHLDARSGLVGTVLAVRRHRDRIYAATSRGLHVLDTAAGRNSRFVKVEGLPGLAWSLLDFDGRLLIGSLGGVFELQGDRAHQILAGDSALSLLRSRVDPARVFIGTSGGLRSVRWDGRGWVDEPLNITTGSGTYSLMEDGLGRLWAGSQGESIYRLSFDARPGVPLGLAAVRQERFGSAEGLVPGLIHVAEVAGEPIFATGRGLLRYDEAQRRFVPAPGFETLFPGGVRLSGMVQEDEQGRVWMHVQHEDGRREVGMAVPGRHGRYVWDSAPLRSIAGAPFSSLHVETGGTAWIGTEAGLHRYDASPSPRSPASFRALIRSVTGHNGTVHYAGSGAFERLHLPHRGNGLRFEYAAPSYESIRSNRFQVYLEGVDAEWSDWSTEGYRDYTNLPPGRHRFRVRARNVHNELSEEAVYELEVHPPWYLAWWAWTLYGMTGVALAWGGIRWRSAALVRRNEALARLVTQRTDELSQANAALHGANEALQDANRALAEQSVTDPLTGLRNRRHLVEAIPAETAFIDRQLRDGVPAEPGHLVFLLLDIDHFKSVNDQYGHAAGDRMLEQFRDILLKVARTTDTVVRWGGEEFLIVARAADAHAGAHLAERVRAEVASHHFELGHGDTVQRSCSIGFARYPFFRSDPQRLGWERIVDLADQALYVAKRGGRNAWVGIESAADVPPPDFERFMSEGIEHLLEAGAVRLVRPPRAA